MGKNGHLILPFELGPNRTVWDEEELYKWIEKEKTKGVSSKKPRENKCQQNSIIINF